MADGFGITQANLMTIAAAGVGAAGAGFASAFIPVQNVNTKNIVLAAVGAIIAGTARGPMRALGIGLGAVAVADLVRVNFLMAPSG